MIKFENSKYVSTMKIVPMEAIKSPKLESLIRKNTDPKSELSRSIRNLVIDVVLGLVHKKYTKILEKIKK